MIWVMASNFPGQVELSQSQLRFVTNSAIHCVLTTPPLIYIGTDPLAFTTAYISACSHQSKSFEWGTEDQVSVKHNNGASRKSEHYHA